MLVSCSYCGLVHERGYKCNKALRTKRIKEANYITRFRSSRLWKKKRDEIKKRDKFLCQVCLLDKYFTERRYNFENLEVHHIIPLCKNFELRMENSNLITICSFHHKLAENGNIPMDELTGMIKNVYTF